jgi:hypothetical protein
VSDQQLLIVIVALGDPSAAGAQCGTEAALRVHPTKEAYVAVYPHLARWDWDRERERAQPFFDPTGRFHYDPD